MENRESAIIEGYVHESFFEELNEWIWHDEFNEEYLAVVRAKREPQDIKVSLRIDLVEEEQE